MTYLMVIGERVAVLEGYRSIRCDVGSLFVAEGVAFAPCGHHGVVIGDSQAPPVEDASETATPISWENSNEIRIRAGMTGRNAVFYATYKNAIYISDDPSLIAVLVSAPINTTEVAVRLSSASGRYPFSGGVMWQGVHMVSPGMWLIVRQGVIGFERWWQPPTKELDFKEAVYQVRQGLKQGVSDSLESSRQMAVDISGKPESTVVAYTLAEQHNGFKVITVIDDGTTTEDITWARRAVSDMICEHHLLNMFGHSPIYEPGYWRRLPEGPSEADVYLPAIAKLDATVVKEQPTMYLTGIGGAELFGQVTPLPWSLVRDKAVRGLFQAVQVADSNKITKSRMLRLIFQGGSPSDDLLTSARSRLVGGDTQNNLDARWVPLVGLPAFASETAGELLRDELKRHAQTEDLALDKDRSRHHIYASVLRQGTVVRRLNRMSSSPNRLEVRSPYLERRVIEPALALRAENRMNGQLIEPVLAESRPRLMPAQFFLPAEQKLPVEPYWNPQERVAHWFSQGSVLADMGLIDLDQIMAVASTKNLHPKKWEELQRAYRMELWLRSYNEGQSQHRSSEGSQIRLTK